MTTIIESLPANCSIVKLDCGSFVMPWKEFRASASQLARMAMATVMPAIAASLLATNETEMLKEAKRRAKIPEGRAVSVPKHLWAEQGPVHLMPGRDQGLPVTDNGEGRVYAKGSFPTTKIVDSTDPDGLAKELIDLGAEISYRSLTEAQAGQRATAEFYVQRHGALRERRLEEGGRVTPEERASAVSARRILLRLHRELVEQDEARSVVRARHAADATLRRWRRETLTARREVLETKGLQRRVLLDAVWQFRVALRKAKPHDWLDVPARGSDDGLKNLFENEHLTMAEYAQGMRYRRLYVATERNLRSGINFDRIGAREDNREAKDWGAALVDRKAIEAMIMAAAKGNGRMLTTLRLVAGEGRTINNVSKASSGSDRIMNRKALKAALGLMVEHASAQA